MHIELFYLSKTQVGKTESFKAYPPIANTLRMAGWREAAPARLQTGRVSPEQRPWLSSGCEGKELESPLGLD